METGPDTRPRSDVRGQELMLDVGRRTSDVRIQTWRILSTPPLSGEENMRYDAELLKSVEEGSHPPTLRLFRFKERTVSFGRLQKLMDISPLVPSGWDVVQRPTGGGLVFHGDDLCLSLSWQDRQAPLPLRPQEQYRWIHSVVLDALTEIPWLPMAACCDVPPPE